MGPCCTCLNTADPRYRVGLSILFHQEERQLQVPLLAADPGEDEIHSEHAGSSPPEGDVEQGMQPGSEAEGQSNKLEEDNAIELVSAIVTCFSMERAHGIAWSPEHQMFISMGVPRQ